MTDGIDYEGPKLLLGQLDQLPRWATCCSDCGVIHAERVPCPVCSLRTDNDQDREWPGEGGESV